MSTILNFAYNLETLLTKWGSQIEVSVFLNETITPQQKSEIENVLTTNPNLTKVEYVSQAQALQRFQTQTKEDVSDLLQDPEILASIPASFQFTLASKAPKESHSEYLSRLAADLQSLAGVNEVSYGQEWIKNFSGFLSLARAFSAFIVLVFCAACLLVISNALRASISARRSEIEILELVGATRNLIRTPFMIESLVLSTSATIVGLLLSALSMSWFKSFMIEQAQFLTLSQELKFLNLHFIGGFILTAVLLALGSVFFVLRSINQGWAAAEKA
jgi:cell division transport system permease protein